jgi:hypothetical protein
MLVRARHRRSDGRPCAIKSSMASGTGSTRHTVPSCGQPLERFHAGFGSTGRAFAATCVISCAVRNMDRTVSAAADEGKAPARVRLHFVHDPVFAVA